MSTPELLWQPPPEDWNASSRAVANQFDLTTPRLDEAAVLALIEDERALTLQLRLLDRFSDNGISAAASGRLADNDLTVDLWLISFRVLGCDVETATLNPFAARSRRLGATRLIHEYRPTVKNGMVREHYARLGFEPLDRGPDGSLALLGFRSAPTCIRTLEA
jgi:FkbH-like protein